MGFGAQAELLNLQGGEAEGRGSPLAEPRMQWLNPG